MLGAFCEDCEMEKSEKQGHIVGSIGTLDVAQHCWVRVYLKGSNGWVDIEQPPGFRFDIWLGLVRGTGGVSTSVLHIPMDNILMFTVLQDPTQQLAGMHVPNPTGRPN